MSKRCWLIGDWRGQFPTLAAQFARLRGFAVNHCPTADGLLPSVSPAAGQFIATSFQMLERMSNRDRESLRSLVTGGAVLYLRGDAEEGLRYSLAPIVDASFVISPIARADSYHFTRSRFVPRVLHDEQGIYGLPMHGASGLSGQAEALMLACERDRSPLPVILAYRNGKGAVICDLQPDQPGADSPIAWRLADPIERCASVGALIAADHAAGRDMSAPVGVNFVIDDVPLAYDFFNEPVLNAFLEHLDGRWPGVHLDCAWIPENQFTSRRYVEILRRHNAGFIWHGLYRHVDHTVLEDPAADLEAGKQAVERISNRYGVRLQPVIVFPMERMDPVAERVAMENQFLAGIEQPREDEPEAESPMYLRYSTAVSVHEGGFRFLHRYESKFLTRDRMVAMATLGDPIIAFCHPKDVGLKRLSRFIDRGGSVSHFDHILDFAAAKGLAPRSLEEIARQMLAQDQSEAPAVRAA